MTILNDTRVERVLDRLHREDQRQFWPVARHFLLRAIGRLVSRQSLTLADEDLAFLRDKLVAIDRSKGELTYVLCRALNARRAVEVGTSHGVSTIYLAAAIRDNSASSGPAGIVIGSEIEPEKARTARANLDQAGLAAFADIREGDALQTLRACGGEVDFLLLDTWIPVVRPAIELIAPQLRPGAIVVCDNVQQFEKEYRPFTEFIREPSNGFRSMVWPGKGGLEISVKV
jgi:predicted O-methyltransferase YrrM